MLCDKHPGSVSKKELGPGASVREELSLDLDLKFVYNSRCGLSLSRFEKKHTKPYDFG